MRRSLRMQLAVTLLVGSSLTLAGCQAPMPEMRQQPVKPTLTSVNEVGRQMCMSLEDASKLGIYIIELERGYL